MACGGVLDDIYQKCFNEEQLEEVTALEAIFDEQVTVISKPDEDGLYRIKIDVQIDLPKRQIRVDVWVPYEYDVDGCQQVDSGSPSPVKPNFSRSDSGKRWHTSFDLSYITPLCLIVTLPKTYPADRCPDFSLSCEWLDCTQITVLCKQLDELWTDSYGFPVIYTWINWLQNNTLSHLGLDRSVVISPFMEEDDSRDPRALPECNDLRESLQHLLQHDFEEEKKAFLRSYHSCGICFDEKLGYEFYRIEACTHHFCGSCMKGYCDTHVREGTVHLLKCPEHDCDEQIPPFILKDVLGVEAFERWERLTLQRGLEKMGVVYCPHCQTPTLKDETSDFAQCTACMFSFCTICRDNWHPGEKCNGVMEKLAKLEESFKLMDAKKGNNEEYIRKTRLLKLEYLNAAMVKQISRPCPKCKADIQKWGGCNKVTCIRCGAVMCWICKSLLGPWSFHFNTYNSDCPLQGSVIPTKERPYIGPYTIQQKLQQDPEVKKHVVRCPRCNQQYMRADTNNHMKCWTCKANFCFQCKKIIIGPVMQHFTVAMPCNQHGD